MTGTQGLGPMYPTIPHIDTSVDGEKQGLGNRDQEFCSATSYEGVSYEEGRHPRCYLIQACTRKRMSVLEEKMRRVATVLLAVSVAACGRAQDPLKTLPHNYWVEFEDPAVRVVHAHYGAGEHVPQHDHSRTPVLYVYLSAAGPVKFVHTGDDDFSLVRKPVQIGQLRLSPGRLETHRVESLSKTSSDFLRVEFKTLPLHLDSMHARATAAGEDFWRAAQPERVEFDDAHLRIVREGVQPGKSAVFESHAAHVVWLAVRVDGAQCAGKAAHAGEGWDAAKLDVQAGAKRVEILRVELK
jgi:hypothetical protein